jgi:hypothetical protein
MKRVILVLFVVLFLDGCSPASRKFYPIGIYTVPTEKAFLYASEAEFNTVVIYDTDPEVILKAERLATRHGLRLVCHPGYCPRVDGSFDGDRVDRTLSKLKDSKTMLAWYLFDEPEVHGLRPDHLHNFHLYVRERSPHTPTAFVVSNGEKYRDYAACSDIAMLDWYPIPLYPLESIAHHIRECRAYTGRSQSLWMVLQAFDWTPFSKTVRDKGTGRVPTYEELRFMTLLSVVEGVDGLFYWTYETPKGQWIILHHVDLWEDLREVVHELNALYSFLISRKDVEGLTISENGTPSRGRVRCLLRKVARSDLRKAGRIAGTEAAEDFDAGYYLLAVNASGESIDVEFSGIEIGDRDVVEAFAKTTLELKGGAMNDVLQPYGVRLYHLGM